MNIELRNNQATISGYVNAVERDSKLLTGKGGKFIERVKQGTFAKALERNPVGLKFNHVRSLQPLEMHLEEDAIGLKCTCVVDDAEVLQAIENNELRGWSFGMSVNKDSWTTRDDGVRVRTLEDINLGEVSILTITPAYDATVIECRSLDDENISIDKQEDDGYNKLKQLKLKTEFELIK